MKLILIIIPENCVVATVTDTIRFFARANDLLKSRGDKPLFEWKITGFSKTMCMEESRLSFSVDYLLNEAPPADLVIIPAVNGDAISATQLNRHYIGWLLKQFEGGAEILSYSTGSFLLAATGLLNQKVCAVNKRFKHEFAWYYNDVEADMKNPIAESNRIYTCSGETSYWHLLLHVLSKQVEGQMAVDMANFFSVNNQIGTDWAIMDTGTDDADAFIQDIKRYIAAHVTEKITATTLAKTFFVHKRTLERRFLKATGESPGSYIQKQKIDEARKELQSGYRSIEDVMRHVGYSDAKAFRLLFKKMTGLLPAEYANRYRCPLWSKHFTASAVS